jgi:hypothetical protein
MMTTNVLVGTMQRAPDAAHIGYLVPHPEGIGCGFLCFGCVASADDEWCKMYGINLNPYKAVCVRCYRVVVEGCGVELMDGR